jgi:hypothetical protein
MNKQLLATVIAAALGCGVATAQTTTNAVESNAQTQTQTQAQGGPTILTQEGKDAKEHSKAEYKARKKVAEANKELNKADCETSSNGMAEHACKKNARAISKQEKAEAKMIHENEKKDIKQNNAQ